MELLKQLSQNADGISVVLTLLLIILNVVFALQNRQLFKENRLLRLASREPYVQVFYELGDKYYGSVMFSVLNTGTGPAFDLQISTDLAEDDLRKLGILNNSKQDIPFDGLPFLASQQRQSHFMKMSWDIPDGSFQESEFTLTYKSIDGRTIKSKSKLCLESFDSVTRLGKPSSQEIAEPLNKISGYLQKIANKK